MTRIETQEAAMEKLFRQASKLHAEAEREVAASAKSSEALLGSSAASLTCLTELCECYQEFLQLFETIQLLYANEIHAGKHALRAIAEADRSAADNIMQA